MTASNDKTIKLWTLQSGGGGGGGNDTRSNTTGTLDSLSPTEQQLSDTAAAGGDSSLVSVSVSYAFIPRTSCQAVYRRNIW